MKQYTTTEQTAKLIELGFEKPKFEIETQLCNIKGQPLRAATIVGNYSIGELIEMLPPYLNDEEDEDYVFELTIYRCTKWTVSYDSIFELKKDVTENELIDALFGMLVLLKEEGVI